MSRIVCKHPCCNRSYRSQEFMLQHYTDSHCTQQSSMSKKRSPCTHCNRSFSTAAGLDQHFMAVHLSGQLRSNIKHKGSSSIAATADDDDDVAPPILQHQIEVACNDCGKSFQSTDSLHQHQWDSAQHTRVSRTRMPNYGSDVRGCSQCTAKFSTANDLEQHFMQLHPLSELPESDEQCTRQHLAQRFRLAWKKPKVALPSIHRIFKVYNPGWRRKGFEEYRKELKRELANHKVVKLGTDQEDIIDDVRNKVLRDGNELQRYHGTTVRCRLGSSSSSLCFDPGCSLCRILQSGFNTSKCINMEEDFQRFGTGIYCSSVSSKADNYVRCSSLQYDHKYGSVSSCKVMMVCTVLAGDLHRSSQNPQNVCTTSPPSCLHSVEGDPGEVLNSDELMVYNGRAILPAYIILYSSVYIQS